MQQGVDYELVKGRNWLPFGRIYRTLKPIMRPNGKIIPAGREWNGATGVPMAYDSKYAYAFLCHDEAFGLQDMNVIAANNEAIHNVYVEGGIIPAFVLAMVFHVILLPTVLFYWMADSRGPMSWLTKIVSYLFAIVNIYVDYQLILMIIPT